MGDSGCSSIKWMVFARLLYVAVSLALRWVLGVVQLLIELSAGNLYPAHLMPLEFGSKSRRTRTPQ